MRNSERCSLAIVLMFLFSGAAFAQTNAKGLDFDDEQYAAIPKKALTRSIDQLPASASLKNYCPTPKSQGNHGTCAAWATAYCATTIMEAKKKGWTDKEQITNNALSPAFLFRVLKPDDAQCVGGSSLGNALQLMKEQGSVSFKQVSDKCIPAVTANLLSKAATNKIDGYMTLFGSEASNEVKIRSVKKSLAEKKPVVIGMVSPPSFDNAKDVWKPTERPDRNYGGHAVCVIGYDDNKDGGSFEIQNSWGTWWGNQGYIWVNYETFARFTSYAFEVVNLPEAKPDVVDLSGEIKLVLANKQEMPTGLLVSTRGLSVVPAKTTAGPLTLYRTNNSYNSGTRFRIYITNNEPAFVYAISSDLTQEVTKIFPYADDISAALTDRKTDVAIPDEEHFIEFDAKPGKDFLCVLYSKTELDINDIVAKVQAQQGSFNDRVYKVLSDKLVDPKNIQFSANKISFKGFSKGKSIIPMMVEMEHK